MTWWGDAIVWGSFTANMAALLWNLWQIRHYGKKYRGFDNDIDALVRKAKLVGYQQGYADALKERK